MIDVHVLTHSKTRSTWLAQCLASLKGEPCTVHIVQGVEGNISAGRAIGFALGSQPFVTFVDSDDYVLPGAMTAVIKGLNTGAAAVVTGEYVLSGNNFQGPNYGHHLFAMRREIITPHLQRYAADFSKTHCGCALASIAKPVVLKETAYVWRLHQAQTHRLYGQI